MIPDQAIVEMANGLKWCMIIVTFFVMVHRSIDFLFGEEKSGGGKVTKLLQKFFKRG